MLIRGGGRGAGAPGGCCPSGFAAVWMLLNFSPRRRISEVICLSLAGSTSRFDISGIAVFAGASIPLSPVPLSQPLDASVLADLKTQVLAVEFLGWTCRGRCYKACHHNPVPVLLSLSLLLKFFCFHPPSPQ